ncbi:MAG: hypothetical protein R2911_29400 [Caldilineaceae bacterium]
MSVAATVGVNVPVACGLAVPVTVVSAEGVARAAALVCVAAATPPSAALASAPAQRRKGGIGQCHAYAKH